MFTTYCESNTPLHSFVIFEMLLFFFFFITHVCYLTTLPHVRSCFATCLEIGVMFFIYKNCFLKVKNLSSLVNVSGACMLLAYYIILT